MSLAEALPQALDALYRHDDPSVREQANRRAHPRPLSAAGEPF
jgi:hypothetical protein